MHMNTDANDTIGARIKALREDRGLTQAALAERAGVHPVTVAKWESGAISNLPINTLRTIADALDATVGDVLPDCELGGSAA